MKRQWGIKDLRKLGGEWKAIQASFGTYRYEGKFYNDDWEIKSFAHMAHLWDGDDENFVVKWHIYRNGNPVGYPTHSPIPFLEGHKENAERKNK